MPRNFANNGLVTLTAGGLAALDGGPVTMAAIIKLTDSVNGAILYAGTSTSVVSFAMEIFSNNYSFTTSAGGQNCVGGTNSDNWHMACISKATGTATPRGHKYVYDTDTWTHSNAAGTLADGAAAPGGGGVVQLGRYATTEFINADIAIIGCWDRVLSDAEAELLPFSLQSWYHTGPVGLWILDQADTATKVLDVTGNGANESALTVTSVSTLSVPVFSYGFGDMIAAGHSAAGSSTDAPAETTSATGAANAATVSVAPNADVTAATGTAQDAAAAIAVNAESAAGTGTAFDATVSTAAQTSANAENAAATGTANSPSIDAGVAAEATSGSGQANDAAPALTVNADVTAGIGTANTATVSTGAQPAAAAATGTAFDASISITVAAELITAIAAAFDATTSAAPPDARATSDALVTAGRTSTSAVTAKRTSSGGVT